MNMQKQKIDTLMETVPIGSLCLIIKDKKLMCFWKSEQSKVLKAKRDIVVYKIGDSADENTFVPYFMNSFTYKTNGQCQICPDFKSRSIAVGFHSYINIIVSIIKSYQFHVVIRKNTERKPMITIYSTFQDTLYLGKFIIPKGAMYCVNDLNEIVSNQMIYTGQYSSVWRVFDINLKELWKDIPKKEYNGTLGNIVKHFNK